MVGTKQQMEWKSKHKADAAAHWIIWMKQLKNWENTVLSLITVAYQIEIIFELNKIFKK